MNVKHAVLASLLGGVTIFVWGAVAHMAPPPPVTVLSNTAAVDDFLAKNAPANGSYMDPRGVMVSVGFLPGKPDKSLNMGPQLIIELITDIVQAFILYWLLLQVKPTSILGYGVKGMILALFAWVSIEISYWNWYSFSDALVLMGLLDAIGGGFLAALVVGWYVKKSA